MSLRERLEEDLAKLAPAQGAAVPIAAVIPLGTANAHVVSADKSHSPSLPPDIEPTAAQVAEVRGGASDKNTALKGAFTALIPKIDQYGTLRFLITVPTGRLDALVAESQAALDMVAALVQSRTGATPGQELLKRELAPIRARARERRDRIFVHNRVAQVDGSYLLDLGDVAGNVVRISPTGYFVETNSEVCFQRGDGYGELPAPVLGISPKEAWDRLLDWLDERGVPAASAPLLAVLIAEWLRSDTPAPVCELVGSAGGGKTTLAEQLGGLIDASDSGLVCVKLSEDDIAAAACNRYVLGVDNASSLGPDEQDLACRVSTGTTISARRYYTQGDIFQVFVRSPVVITSILPALTRSDARSRTITVRLSALRQYRSAVELMQEFKERRTALLGCICSLLSAGLAALPTARSARVYTHRLADYEQLGEAITTAVGWNPGSFGARLIEERRVAAEEVHESDPIISTVIGLIETYAAVAHVTDTRPALNTWADKLQAGYYAIQTSGGAVRVGMTLRHLLGKVRMHPLELDLRAPINTERMLSNGLTLRYQTLRDLGVQMHTQRTRFGQVVEFKKLPSRV